MAEDMESPVVDPSNSYHFLDPFEMKVQFGNATISLWGDEANTAKLGEPDVEKKFEYYGNPYEISVTCPALRLSLEGPLYHHGQSCTWNSEYEDEESERRRQVETDLSATVRAALAADRMFETAWLNGRIEKIYLGENNTVKTLFSAHLRVAPIVTFSDRIDEDKLLHRIRQLMIEYGGYIFRLKGVSTEEEVELKEDYGDLPKILEDQERRIDKIMKIAPTKCPIYPAFTISESWNTAQAHRGWKIGEFVSRNASRNEETTDINVYMTLYRNAEMVPWKDEYEDASAPETQEMAKQLCAKMDQVIQSSVGLWSSKPECKFIEAMQSAARGVRAALRFRLFENVLIKYKFTVNVEKFLRFIRNIVMGHFIDETVKPTCFRVNVRGIVYRYDEPVPHNERIINMKDEEAFEIEADLCTTTKEALTSEKIFDQAWYKCSRLRFIGPSHGKLECELRLVFYGTASMSMLDDRIEPTIQDLMVQAGKRLEQSERYHFMVFDHIELQKPED